ncbi:MAG: NAD-dependent epimerase/dehydratase family protein [Candidatus Limnocylindrales bacterium]
MTGGAGFIGSHLVERLLAEGAAVLVLDDLSTGRAAQVAPEARIELIDLAADDTVGVVGSWAPDVIMHLAAQASVPSSIRDPLRDLAVNVVGTHRLTMAARAAGVRRFVFVSSGGAVYGETLRPMTERSLPAPLSYYGIHKLAGEGHVALGGMPYAIARPSNVYGPRQSAGLEGAVVAAFVSQAFLGGPLRIHGDGRQTRDFVHVTDLVDALVRLADPAVPSGTWNVAVGRQTSILRLADLVERVVARSLQREFLPRRPGDVTHAAMSSTRLRALGWRPSVSLESGLAELAHPSERAWE